MGTEEEGSVSVPNVPPVPEKDGEEFKPTDDFKGEPEELENDPDEVDK